MQTIHIRLNEKSSLKDDIKFRCEKCGKCCKGDGVVYLTVSDLRHLAKFFHMNLPNFFHNYCSYVEETRIIGKKILELPAILLKKKGNGKCIFLRENQCAIHKNKPFMCGAWPFLYSVVYNPDFQQKMPRICPGLGHGKHFSVRASLYKEREEAQEYVKTLSKYNWNMAKVLGFNVFPARKRKIVIKRSD